MYNNSHLEKNDSFNKKAENYEHEYQNDKPPKPENTDNSYNNEKFCFLFWCW